MMVIKEISSYEVMLISNYNVNPNQIAFVYFTDPANSYFGYAGIIKTGAPLPANVQHANGILNIYFSETMLVPMLDTLRNEKPVYAKFNTDLKWGSVGTGKEPAGEQEN